MKELYESKFYSLKAEVKQLRSDKQELASTFEKLKVDSESKIKQIKQNMAQDLKDKDQELKTISDQNFKRETEALKLNHCRELTQMERQNNHKCFEMRQEFDD